MTSDRDSLETPVSYPCRIKRECTHPLAQEFLGKQCTVISIRRMAGPPVLTVKCGDTVIKGVFYSDLLEAYEEKPLRPITQNWNRKI